MPTISFPCNSWGLRHVKDVFTLSGEDGTVVAGDVTVGTAAVKGDTTDSADVVVWDIPFPDGHGVDAFDFDFHPRPQKSSKICSTDVDRLTRVFRTEGRPHSIYLKSAR